jgi:outer membrane protein assembly factor BamB
MTLGRIFRLRERVQQLGAVTYALLRRGRAPMKIQSALLKLMVLAAAAAVLVLTVFIQGCSQGGQASQSSAASPADPAEEAIRVIEKAGVKGGLVLHINSGNGVLTESLRVSDKYLVQGMDHRAENVLKARQYIKSKGKYGPVSVDRLIGNHLPYTDNLINLIVAENLGDISMGEVMRVLSPNGVAMVRQGNVWKRTVKPRPAGMDEWNHYLHGADGNMVSADELISPVKHYQWVGSPLWSRHHDTTASMSALVSANGRIFYIIDEGSKQSIQLPPKNFLVARDAFSGVILWKVPIGKWENHLFPLKSGPAYLPRRLVAVGDRVFVTLGINAPLSELDAATGKIVRSFPKTEQTSEVLFSDNTLFLVVGRPEKTKEAYAPKHTYIWDEADRARSEWAWGEQAAQIVAIAAGNGDVLWQRQYPVAPLSLTADSKAVYFYDGAKMVCLNRRNGQENWQSEAIKRRAIDTAYAPRIVVSDNVVLFSTGLKSMMALSAADGKKLWEAPQPPSGHYSPEDIFVIDGVVWSGATSAARNDGKFVGYDIHTGKLLAEVPSDTDIYYFHQRCYPNKATGKYILTSRTGIEFVDLKQKHWTVNHYVRGGCYYGIMPGNGLVYTPPHACACYMEAKLNGFCALRGAFSSELDLKAASTENRLEKGPAYNTTISAAAVSQEWPTFRHDAERSSFTASQISSNVKPQWQVKLGGKLSSPVVADNRVFISKVDEHTIYAIDATTGAVTWNYTVGGRVDSPPTIYKGRVLFGSADGYVYCLRASDGALVWRFRAAPMDRRMVAYEQVESVWPVHGSVLVQNNRLYCVAGRSMFLDGGLRLLELIPETGQKVTERVLDENNPDTGKNLQTDIQGLNMPVGLPDILSSDGKYLYMRSQQFDLEGNRIHVGVRDLRDQTGEGAHVFSPVGFLDSTDFYRSYMIYGKSAIGGWGAWEKMGQVTPSGQMIAVNGDTVFGYARKPQFLSESTVQDYELYAAAKSSDAKAVERVLGQYGKTAKVNPKGTNYVGDWKLREGLPLADQTALSYRWSIDRPPLQVRAMVVADKTLFVAGPPNILSEEDFFFTVNDSDVQKKLAEQQALLEGKNGALLWAVSATDGKKLAEYRLQSLPVWNGMIASRGKLYLATMDGQVISYSEKGR